MHKTISNTNSSFQSKCENNKESFSEMKAQLDDEKHPTSWYQKTTDIGLILSFTCSAPLQNKKLIGGGI